MTVLPKIEAFAADLTAIRQDIHAHPELGFEEVRTAGIVAEKLRAYGVDEVHEGLGGTGVVGIIKGAGGGNRRVGLRADMDALPIVEDSGVPYALRPTPGGCMPAATTATPPCCLGAARYLAETRDFDGTVVLIFQPAEEGLGGARRMLEEGLFEKFPCDEIYGMHNDPNSEPGVVNVTPGAAMAGAAFFDITVKGTGSHAAMPHQSRDPIVIGTALVQQLQSVVSRNTPPTKPIVLSVTKFNAGSAYNVVPDTATIAGTIRFFHQDVIEMAEARMRELCAGMATAYGIEIAVDIRNVFDVLMNDPELTTAYVEAAASVVGGENAHVSTEQASGSEDFADMLQGGAGRLLPGGSCGQRAVAQPRFRTG